jgi:hypothetical protein
MPQSVAEYSKKVVDYLKIVDEKQRINEYTWLIRGFFEIVLGEAPSLFRICHRYPAAFNRMHSVLS